MKKLLITLFLAGSVNMAFGSDFVDPYKNPDLHIDDETAAMDQLLAYKRDEARAAVRRHEAVNDRLHDAVQRADVQGVKDALRDGANLQSLRNGKTAYQKNDDEVDRLLLEKTGGESEFEDEAGFSQLDPEDEQALQDRKRIGTMLGQHKINLRKK